MQRHRGLLHAQLLFRQAEVDFALLALQRAHDLRLRGFEARPLYVVARGGEVQLVLLGGDARLGRGLIQRGLRLAKSGLLLLQLLAGAAGVEANYRLARGDRISRRGQPHDLQIRHIHRRSELHRPPGFQLAAATHDDQKIPFSGRSDGQTGRRLQPAHLPGAGCQQSHQR